MTQRIFLFLAVAMIVSSCAGANPPPPTSTPSPTVVPPTSTVELPLPTVTPVCASPEPTQEDINHALVYTGETFNSSDWERTYVVAQSSVNVTWQNVASGALTYLEVIIIPCGYEEPDLNAMYSDENWSAVFQNYESYKQVGKCKTNDGLRLYEFETQNQGFEYGVKYWVKSDTDTRIISTMIVFPLELKALLDDYSARLFPDYSTCP